MLTPAPVDPGEAQERFTVGKFSQEGARKEGNS